MIRMQVCDSCDAEFWGASKRDLLDDGWKFHDASGGRMFVMCGSCERRYADLRGEGRRAAGEAVGGLPR